MAERWPVGLKAWVQTRSNVKLEGVLYSVFFAEASKRPWMSMKEQGMRQTPSLLITHLIWQSPTLEDATAWEPWAMSP